MVYRSAIIGCGAIGGGYGRSRRDAERLTHAGAYHLSPRTRLVAAVDPDPAALARFGRRWNISALFTDHRQMLKEVQPDIVSLCLPTRAHWPAFRDACSYGVKGIFCEKPLSAELRHARRMVTLSKERLVSVNYFRRWNPSLVTVRRELAEGRLGRPVQAVVRYTKGVFGNGSHFVDLARWFWGEPEHVQRIRRVERPDGDPGVDFTLRFTGGPDVLFLHVPAVDYVFLDVDILTDRGRVVIGQRGQNIEHSRAAIDPYYGFTVLRRLPVRDTRWRESLPAAVRELARCLSAGGAVACTAYDGLRAMEICHEAAGPAARRRA